MPQLCCRCRRKGGHASASVRSSAHSNCLFENAHLGWKRARPQPEGARCGPRSIGRGKSRWGGSVPDGSDERGVGHGSSLVAPPSRAGSATGSESTEGAEHDPPAGPGRVRPAGATCIVRHQFVRERRASPMTCFQYAMPASTKAPAEYAPRLFLTVNL
jgi:hypothetical protein